MPTEYLLKKLSDVEDKNAQQSAELINVNKELAFQNEENKKRLKENKELEAISNSVKQASLYARSLIEASLDPLVTISPDGKIMDVNEASVRVTGVQRLQLIGTDFSDYFTEPQKAREGYKQVFEKEFVADYPLTILHKNGKLTEVLYNASVYKDEKGNVLGVFAAARDVTQQKAAEEKIRQSEKMFKSIFDNSLAAIVVTNDKGNYLSANKAAGEVLGYTVKELLQMNVGDLKTTAKRGSAERFEEYLKKGEEAGEFDFITNNGVNKFVQYRAIRTEADFNLSIMMDITDQKQASQYARSLIEVSLDPLVTISPDGKIMDVNEASVKVTGVPRLKLIGTDFSDYFTEPQKAREGYKQVFEKEFVSDYPLTIHHKNGTLTDVLYNASVYKDEKGNVLGVFAAARDVTAQKQASQYARSLIEASLDPLVTISPEGKITDVNEASIKVTGVPRIKLIGSDFSDYFTEPQKALEGYRQVFEKEFVSDYPLTIHHKNGTLTDVLYNASVYKDNNGNVLGVFAAARDVTAKKAEELSIANKELILQNKKKEKQAAVLEMANKELAFQNEEKEKRADELIVANKELAFQNEEKEKRADELIVANKELAFQNIEKEKRADELIVANKELAFQNEEKEKRADELIVANKELAFQNEEKEKRANELIVANKELAFQNKEKEKRAYELFVANKELAFQNEEKEKRADELIVANKELAFQNIEKEKRADELFVANKELAFQNEEKEQFVYIVSHDLQEPLKTISNYAGLFNTRYKSKLDGEANTFLDAITRATARMQMLIKDILDYSLIQKDETKTKIDCNVLLKEIMDDMEISLTESKAHIYAEGLPVVNGYLSGIKSLFQNLISNAVKYRKADTEPIIKITAVSKEKEWLFAISDNGIGIEAAFYNKLFIIFQRLHNKNEYSGTGIGLARCKKIVELHGGTIWLESAIDKGSTFYFTISKLI